MFSPSSAFDSPWGWHHWFTLGALFLFLWLPFAIRGRGFVESLKRSVLARIRIRSQSRKRIRKFRLDTDLRRSDLTPVDLGVVPSAVQYELEKPRRHSFRGEGTPGNDGIHFVGISAEGHVIDVCVNRIESCMAEAWVYLKVSGGGVYRSGDARKAYVANEDAFAASGLQIKCLSPLRKWRISFNGLLRKCGSGSSEDGDCIHTKFSFVWLAMSTVQEQNLAHGERTLHDAFVEEARPEDLRRLNEFDDRYEQWGQMLGTVAFEGEEEEEFYFWTLRTRISARNGWKENIKCTKFYMYFTEGTPLKVECLSVENVIRNLVSGFSITPYGAARQISRCRLRAESLDAGREEFSFSCNVGKETKEIKVNFVEGAATFLTGSELQLGLDLLPFRATMNGTDEGFGIAHRLSSSSHGRRPFEFPPLLLKDPGYTSEKSLLLLEDEMCKSSAIAGGKGSSLALLTQLAGKTHKFVVPRGFVVSTAAFQRHLKENEKVYDAVQKLREVACKIREGDLKAECASCVATFGESQLSESLKEEVASALHRAYGEPGNVRFSVRSSAFGEDGEDLSAAGQMLTVLGVRGVDNVCRAVVQCWSSKFGFEAVQYSRQNGQSLLSPMAVVVQEMVPSDFSGVLFTVDPVTGDPSHPYITANFGLGETVVSALADPDTIVLERKPDRSLEVSKIRVGSKQTQVFMKTGEGVEEKRNENHSDSSCMTPEWALKIGEAGILIESCFCSPRDIEWAVHEDRLYLLQARPITTLHNETDFELIHDQDTPVRSTQDFWTRANTGEVFLGAASPLGISIVVAGMDINAHRSHVLREKRLEEFCPYYFHILPSTHRQITLNLVDCLFKHNQKEVNNVQRAFEAALFGRAVITEEMHRAGIKKYGYASKKQKYLGLLMVPMLSYAIPRSVDKVDEEVAKRKFTLDAYTSAEKTYDGILGQINFCCQAFSVHGMVTFLSSYFNMILMTILSKGKKEWDAELYCDFATLLSSCSGVESAEVPQNLQELAGSIAKDLGSTFSSLPVDAAHDLLKDEATSYGKLFKKFLERHGHRCVKEFDVYSKSWGMEPESLILTLQNMVKSPNVTTVASKRVQTIDDILSDLKTPLSSFNRAVLKFLLPKSRRYVCERERTKSLVIKTVDWLRKSCHHLGDLMVKEGMLPDSDLVFFLTLEEIKEVLDTQKPGLVPRAIRRKRLHPRLDELNFPEIMKGIPKPIKLQEDLSCYASSFTLTGTPVCQGTVKGKAVVVVALEEASKIESGDILVTHATDIGWSPYFPLLSGVVTVLGGLISHGAVVAREFGLPCVVGVENATAAFKSGDTVILDGTKGTVTKVIEEEEIKDCQA